MGIDIDTRKVEKQLYVLRQLGVQPKTWNTRALKKVTKMKIALEKLDWKTVRTPVVSQISGNLGAPCSLL